jgi:hypothetical protein
MAGRGKVLDHVERPDLAAAFGGERKPVAEVENLHVSSSPPIRTIQRAKSKSNPFAADERRYTPIKEARFVPRSS